MGDLFGQLKLEDKIKTTIGRHHETRVAEYRRKTPKYGKIQEKQKYRIRIRLKKSAQNYCTLLLPKKEKRTLGRSGFGDHIMSDQVNTCDHLFFSKKAAANNDDGEQTHKRALPKPDRAYFWTGFLNLIAGTLGSNPRFKCISCNHEMNGVQRAAMHLKAEPPEEKLVQLCPNVTEEQAADCRRLYGQKKYKTGATQPQVVPPKPGIRAKTYITGPLKAIADRLFARFIFMSMLPFRLVDKVWFKEFISDGLHVLHKFPDRARLSGELLDAEAARVQKRVDDLLALEDFVELCGDGWSNIRGESIVSYVATCSKGDYYLWSTDASLVDKFRTLPGASPTSSGSSS